MKAGTALGSRVAHCGPVALAMVLATTARAETPTFNRDIAPIVHASCAACHHPGGAGPFNLLAYHDAKTPARSRW